MKNIQQGIFTLRDLRDQMKQISKMGSISKIAGMVPGLSQMVNGVNEQDANKRMKTLVCILDSMTPKEIDSDGKIFEEQPSRMLRVARGSGTSIREVQEVLIQQKMMATMAKKLGGKNGALQNMQNMKNPMNAMRNNPQMAAAQRQMAQMMGGNGGGMPDMSALANMMGPEECRTCHRCNK